MRTRTENKPQPAEKRTARPDDRDERTRHGAREARNRRPGGGAGGARYCQRIEADALRPRSRAFFASRFFGAGPPKRGRNRRNMNCQAAARTAKDRHGRTARTTGGTGVARPFAAIRRQAGRWEPTFATATAENADRNGRPAAGRRPRPGARDRARDRRRHRNRAHRSEAAPRRTGRNSRSTYKKNRCARQAWPNP